MAIPNQLKKFFNQTVTIASKSDSDTSGYNKPVYGTAKSYSAKIEQSQDIFRTDDQRVVSGGRKIFLFTQDTISVEDKITLPAAFPPVNPKILAVRTVTDIPGIHHIVINTE